MQWELCAFFYYQPNNCLLCHTCPIMEQNAKEKPQRYFRSNRLLQNT
jgi:hypothetical protein